MDEQRAVLLLMLLSLSAAFPSPSNLALNKATFSSGQHNKSSSPSVVVDGDQSDSFTAPSTGRFCTQCFLSTPSDNPWWRVDLGGQFFITNISIYTGVANRTNGRDIGPFEILSKETSGNLNLTEDYSQWNVIQSVSYKVATYEYPLPTAVYAQHVAVMEKEDPRHSGISQVLLLTEVEVYGFTPAEFKPTNLQITSVTTDCVSFSWDSPYRSIGASYQYSCDSITWSTATSNTSAKVCGLSPTLSTECSVRIEDMTVTTVSTQLQCSDFAKTPQIQFTTSPQTKVRESSRWRLPYLVTWSVVLPPASCLNPSYPYRVAVNSTSDSPANSTISYWYNEGSYTVYGDVGDTINVTVQTRDTADSLSEPLSTEIEVNGELPPQTAPENFQLTAASSECVKLTNEDVLYPNGPLDGLIYQYNCNSGDWENIPDTKEVCGFTPTTLVNCDIRARRESNSEENQNSDTATSSTTTCTAPLDSSSLSIGLPRSTTNSGRIRWEYTVSWQILSTYLCEKTNLRYTLLVNREYRLTDSEETNYKLYADGDVSIQIILWLKRYSNYSASTYKTIQTSLGLAPQVASRNFKLTAVSPYCVSLSYDHVLYPNGPHSGLVYQMRCENRDWVDIPSNNKSCGYSPYQLVSCDIRATRVSNSAGTQYSQTARAVSVRTQCAAPSLPPDLSSYIREYNYTPVGESKAKVRLYLNLPINNIVPNCENISSIKYKLKEDREYIRNTQYILNLRPFTDYTIEVKVTNNANNQTMASFIFRTMTLEPYDAPVIVRRAPYNTSCVYLEWKEPNQPNGVITKYRHRYYIKGQSAPSWMELNQPPQINNFTACEFKAGDLVTYEIAAGTSAGFGPPVTGDIRVTCGLPIIPEVEISYKTQDLPKPKHKMTLTWEEAEPACDSILYYNLTVKHGEKTLSHDQYLEEEGGRREKMLDMIHPYTNYTIILIAVNNALNQSIPKPQYILTPELAPYDGPGLSVEINSSCVTLSLQSPTEPNGVILSYSYMCDYASTTGSEYQTENADEQSITMCGFPSAERIVCSATATNTAGNSPVTAEFGYTEIAISSSTPAELPGKRSSGKTASVTLHKVDIGSKEASSYLLIIEPEAPQDGSRKKRAADESSGCDLTDLTALSGCYITAELSNSFFSNGDSQVFEVGDGETYGGYDNKPLAPGSNYILHQGVTVKLSDGKILHKFLEPVSFFLHPSCDQKCAVAIGVSLPILVVAVVIGIIFMKRRENKKPLNSSNNNISLTPVRPTASSSEFESLVRSDANERNAVARENLYEKVTSQSVRLSHLEEYVKNEGRLKTEYKSFAELPKPIMEVAVLPKNKGKCRYRGLYPADDSRVILERETEEESDFINASYISGYAPGSPKFIASQGPTAATIDDFWLMIWQQKTSSVVMVTNVVEERKHKCDQYWPDDTSTELRYGDITVSMVSADEWADYMVRMLKVEKDGEVKTVRQYHYTSWPDHGVPDSMSPFIFFYKRVKIETAKTTTPIVVHCSAGVGRTGTFIAMNNLLEQAKVEERVNFHQCVKKMRTCRPSMVQTEDQYVFLHQVVSEYLITKEFFCSPSALPNKLVDQEGANNTYSNTATAVIGAEFDRIQVIVQRHPIDVDQGRRPENQSKNRDMSVLPPNAGDSVESSLRPKLFGPDGTFLYINAVFVNSYRKRKQFIATQLPLVNTMADFWQMIEECEVSVIVQLDPCNKNENFYPATDEEKPLSFGEFSVVRLETKSTELTTVISLRVNKNYWSKKVYILQMNQWGEEVIPANSSMLKYLETLDNYQRKSGDERICVVSLNGGGKCGSFICAHNAVEKMKTEQEVDLYSTVVVARLRRPQFVGNLNIYVKLYRLLEDFAETFSDYANFQ